MHKALIALVAVAVVVGGYTALAKWQSLWPFAQQAPTVSVSPSPSPTTSASASPIGATEGNGDKEYALNCGGEGDGSPAGGPNAFGAQFSWYQRFSSQIITGWTLGSFCYNQTTGQAVYLKHKETAPNSGTSIAQLGTYSIATDTFDKSAPINDLTLYMGCTLANDVMNWTGPAITFQCLGGDGGATSERKYTFNTYTKQLTKIEDCSGNDVEYDCSTKVSAPVPARPWKRFASGDLSLWYPNEWPAPKGVQVSDSSSTDGVILSARLAAYNLGPLVAGACEGTSCYRYSVIISEPEDPQGVWARVQTHLYTTGHGDLSDPKDGFLNGIHVISYGVGGMCSGRTAIFFGPKTTVQVNSYCAGDSDQFDGIVPTVRFQLGNQI